MGFVAAVLLFSFAFTAIVEGDYDDPPRPKISETFSAWITTTKMVKQNSSIVIATEVDGYIASDMQGGRELVNGTLLYKAVTYYYSELHLVKQNVSYYIVWGTNGIKDCQKTDGYKMRPLWAWTAYAKYLGRQYNRDTWGFEDYILRETWYIGVPANDPTTPMDVQAYTKGTDARTLYRDFDPTYQPVDSDFEIPPECQSVDTDHSSQFQHIFDYFDRRKQRKMAPSKEENI